MCIQLFVTFLPFPPPSSHSILPSAVHNFIPAARGPVGRGGVSAAPFSHPIKSLLFGWSKKPVTALRNIPPPPRPAAFFIHHPQFHPERTATPPARNQLEDTDADETSDRMAKDMWQQHHSPAPINRPSFFSGGAKRPVLMYIQLYRNINPKPVATPKNIHLPMFIPLSKSKRFFSPPPLTPGAVPALPFPLLQPFFVPAVRAS